MKSRVTVQKNNRIERDIQPLMPMVITLPVQVDGHDSGCALYVVASPFSVPRATPAGLKNLADEISDLINGRPAAPTPVHVAAPHTFAQDAVAACATTGKTHPKNPIVTHVLADVTCQRCKRSLHFRYAIEKGWKQSDEGEAKS